jgi:hyperosmotically inducible periplasmic protein
MHRATKAFLTVLILTLAVGLSACATNQPADEQVDDAAITTKIKAKLTGDPEINPFNIDVDSEDGVVTLRGEVEKMVAKTEAEKLARNTSGVRRVVNQIKVVSPAEEDDERGSDAWIRTKIQAKYTADTELNPFNIDVDVEDAVVTLSGTVKNADHRRRAEETARDTEGVVRVVNELKTKM